MAPESAFLKALPGYFEVCPDLRTTLSVIQILYLLERVFISKCQKDSGTKGDFLSELNTVIEHLRSQTGRLSRD